MQQIKKIVKIGVSRVRRRLNIDITQFVDDIAQDIFLHERKIKQILKLGDHSSLDEVLKTNQDAQRYVAEFSYRIACAYAKDFIDEKRLIDLSPENNEYDAILNNCTETAWSSWGQGIFDDPEKNHALLEQAALLEQIDASALDQALSNVPDYLNHKETEAYSEKSSRRKIAAKRQWVSYIKGVRASLGYTREKMAMALGLPKHVYESMEDGITRPSPDVIHDLAELANNEKSKIEVAAKLEKMTMREIAIWWCDLLQIDRDPDMLAQTINTSPRTTSRWFQGERPKNFSTIMRWHRRVESFVQAL